MSLAQNFPCSASQQIAIGYPVGTASAETFMGGFLLGGIENGLGANVSPLRLIVDNHGKLPFTFAIHQSNDNGKADAFAAINIDHKGAAVASITVPRGGIAAAADAEEAEAAPAAE